jgi:hypothetical protein
MIEVIPKDHYFCKRAEKYTSGGFPYSFSSQSGCRRESDVSSYYLGKNKQDGKQYYICFHEYNNYLYWRAPRKVVQKFASYLSQQYDAIDFKTAIVEFNKHYKHEMRVNKLRSLIN